METQVRFPELISDTASLAKEDPEFRKKLLFSRISQYQVNNNNY
jgi:hypothetical protein